MLVGRKKTPSLIDTVDYDNFVKKGNFFSISTEGYIRVIKYVGMKDGKPEYVHRFLHRMILNVSPHLQVDHINGNKLDNRRANLRVTDRFGQAQNSKKKSGKYKGVWKDKRSGKWVSQITARRRCYHIGTFKKAKEAAIAYNLMAEKLHGEFAKLNKVNYD